MVFPATPHLKVIHFTRSIHRCYTPDMDKSRTLINFKGQAMRISNRDLSIMACPFKFVIA